MTFKYFSELNDQWRDHVKMPRNKKWLKIVFYPFALLLKAMVIGMVQRILADVKRKAHHREKYKKVIKEGLFFDTVEYHEK